MNIGLANMILQIEFNHTGGVMVSVLASSAEIVGSSPVRVKPKTIKLVFVASPLGKQQ
jgi:hypothetical protein